MMKKYAVIDIKGGDIFGNDKLFDTFDEAKKEADKEFGFLTEYDKSRRESFVIACGEPNDIGCLDDYDVLRSYI